MVLGYCSMYVAQSDQLSYFMFSNSERRCLPSVHFLNVVDEAASDRRVEVDAVDISQPLRRSNTRKTYSRKRLLQ